MDFQFPAGAGCHQCPPRPNLADGGHHRPLLPTAAAGYHRPPLPNIAAAYCPAPMHGTFQPNQIPTFPPIPTPQSAGFPGDDAARKLRKAQIRADILARESDESRLLEEEVRRELYFERGMAQRLREVERLGLLTPPPGNETPLREIDRSMAESLRQLQSFGLILPSPAVESIQAPSQPISHSPEAWVGEMPRVGERSLLDANSHSLDARVGAKQPRDAEIGETLPFPLNNLSDVGLAFRPPRDSAIGKQHGSEMVTKPKRDRVRKRKLAGIKIKKMSEQKASTTSGNCFGGNCFQCGQPGHRRANCPASEEVANYKVSQQIDKNDMNCPASEEVANYKASQQIDKNDMVEEDGGANDKCSRCGQSGHSHVNCLASEEEAEWFKLTQETSDTDGVEEEAEWFKLTQETSDTDGVEVSEAHAPPANNNCFHCGEVGHQRANCPLSSEAKRQKKSHQMRQSNMVTEHNPHASHASNLICHGCGKIGHMMRKCRLLKKQNQRVERVENMKHKVRRAERVENMKHEVLVNGVDPTPGFGGKCYTCGRRGHLSKQCPCKV